MSELPPGSNPNYETAIRFAQIIHWLHGAPLGLNYKELDSRLGISKRTIQRYIKILNEEFSDDKGDPLIEVTRADLGSRLRFKRKGLKMEGSAYELMSLYLALDLMAFLEGTFLQAGAQEALDRLQEQLRREHGHQTAFALKDFHKKFFHRTEAPKDYTKYNDLLKQLFDALVSQKQISLTYQSGNKPEKTYTLWPLSLLMYKRALYLVARDPAPEQGKPPERTFAVERIKRIDLLEEGFAYPQDYDPSVRFQNTFGLVSERQPERVSIQFCPTVVQNVGSRSWHQSQVASLQEDGSLILSFELETGEEFLAWLLSYGHYAKVLEPIGLVEKIKIRLREALEQY